MKLKEGDAVASIARLESQKAHEANKKQKAEDDTEESKKEKGKSEK
jgi:hypothetical protein